MLILFALTLATVMHLHACIYISIDYDSALYKIGKLSNVHANVQHDIQFHFHIQ